MHRSDIYPGQLVIFRGKTAKVEKINPKYIKIITEDGDRWDAYHHSLDAAPAGTAWEVSEATNARLGSVVQFKDERARRKHPQLVVIGKHGGALRLAPLGGTADNSYYRGVSKSQVEVLPITVVSEDA